MDIIKAKNLDEFFHFNDIKPKNKALYILALTHPSKSQNNKLQSYERLEFLGDSLLQFITTSYIYKKFPKMLQGKGTLLRSKVVSTASLSEISQMIGLPKLVYSAGGEAAREVKTSPKVQADLFESITGAIFEDLGLKETIKFVGKFLYPAINKFYNKENKDAKTVLQEIFQSMNKMSVIYQVEILDEKHFVAKAIHDGIVYGEGIGLSKKEAEIKAAENALNKLNLETKENK